MSLLKLKLCVPGVWRERDGLFVYGSVLSKPLKSRARRSGRIVMSEAAVIAMPGSTSVHTIAVVPVTVKDPN